MISRVDIAVIVILITRIPLDAHYLRIRFGVTLKTSRGSLSSRS